MGHRLTCYICSATFTQAGDLKKHTCKQHPESYNECAYCTKYFVTELSLSTHLREAHAKDTEANRRRVCVKKKARKVGGVLLVFMRFSGGFRVFWFQKFHSFLTFLGFLGFVRWLGFWVFLLLMVSSS